MTEQQNNENKPTQPPKTQLLDNLWVDLDNNKVVAAILNGLKLTLHLVNKDTLDTFKFTNEYSSAPELLARLKLLNRINGVWLKKITPTIYFTPSLSFISLQPKNRHRVYTHKPKEPSYTISFEVQLENYTKCGKISSLDIKLNNKELENLIREMRLEPALNILPSILVDPQDTLSKISYGVDYNSVSIKYIAELKRDSSNHLSGSTCEPFTLTGTQEYSNSSELKEAVVALKSFVGSDKDISDYVYIKDYADVKMISFSNNMLKIFTVKGDELPIDLSNKEGKVISSLIQYLVSKTNQANKQELTILLDTELLDTGLESSFDYLAFNNQELDSGQLELGFNSSGFTYFIPSHTEELTENNLDFLLKGKLPSGDILVSLDIGGTLYGSQWIPHTDQRMNWT